MSQSSTPPAATAPDLQALSGLLWAIGGGLVAIAVAMLESAAMGILIYGLWCLATAWRIGGRR